jgi:hypothetical protein
MRGLLLDGYRSPQNDADRLTALYGGVLILSGLQVFSHLRLLFYNRRLLEGAGDAVQRHVVARQIDGLIAFANTVGLLRLLVALAVLVLIAFWQRRLYLNLRALDRSGLRFSASWALIGLIPPLMLVLPPLLAAETWRASHPAASLPEGWRQTPVPLRVSVWGAALLGLVLYFASLIYLPMPVLEDGPLAFQSRLALLEDGLFALWAVAGSLLARPVAARQNIAYASLFPEIEAEMVQLISDRSGESPRRVRDLRAQGMTWRQVARWCGLDEDFERSGNGR